MGGKQTRMRGEERRAFILAHAKKVFAQHSYAEASTDELARASNVTEPMLYKHFGSKKGLFLAVLHEYGDRFLHMLTKKITEKAEQNLLEELGHILVDYRETINADPDIQRVLFQSLSESSDPQIAASVEQHNRQVYTLIYQLLERAQHEGLIREDVDLEVASWGYLNTIFAMQYNVMLDFRYGTMKEMIPELNRLWLHALRS